ncbi:Glutamyl-tRNA(Gln) amidotransferase subunit A-like protein [Hapsidospora chrysogenum ATCC 11550]|uniref:Glutamyl-tRNA(Gln) amidotransferase subunit A-like protein n=1 Tax=Hapsidospora chrysogenum (strain ATCC 11550 / CBS 779.69 / DSM 880 / IAM 14645 / JCM 23072 / IMI 49137) TaxID=857340 RepID=A0A086T9I2_HAPC1|nr:Glutamyl-tRNA(Gln) amidotransferase subunit A-like protein [Hapsidospora chrysogenum ATCC 11550]
MAELNIVEASIDDLQRALSSGSLTSVDLAARYLRRISTYDCRNVALNAIPILNNSIFDEAAASDDRRASGAHPRPLEGIPYTIKDSFKVKGMAAAAGSPAFRHLIANEDAFIVETIRGAGGILVGRTNMPAVACGGMQRGIWGRAENPYNPDYLAAAFASGSSNGSAASTAASLAAFGIGAETVSSGRSPASNNALIAYTPSRGWLSIRGNWPLYPTCDVPVPHTRTMMDMLTLLNVIAVEDPVKAGEFWKEQPFVPQPKPWDKKPKSFRDLSSSRSLSGVRIAVPEMFLGQPAPKGARKVDTSPAVTELWKQARKDLESLGAEIVLVPHFPALTAYENDDLLPEGCPRRPQDWNAMERGALIAHAWNDFLRGFNDADLPDLSAVDPFNIYPDSLRTEPELRHFERANAIQYHKLTEYLKATKSLYEVEGLEKAVKALEGMRKILLEDWLVSLDCHCVVFPAAGDVGPANADSNFEGAALAWRNGVYYSNGNRAIRHLGIPTVSVPMGILRDKGVPMNLTFAGKAFDDVSLLQWANAFESKTRHRVPPSHTPALDSDLIPVSSTPSSPSNIRRPGLTIETFKASPVKDGPGRATLLVTIDGTVTVVSPSGDAPQLEVTIDGSLVPLERINIAPQNSRGDRTVFSFRVQAETPQPIKREGLDRTWFPVARDKTMAVMLARASPGGRPTGWLGLV